MVAPRSFEEWQERATARAIAAAKRAVGDLPPGTPIARLSDSEWGWVVAASVASWISVRSEQAASEGLRENFIIRMQGYDSELYDAGAVAAILPELAETSGLDWSKPIGEWPRDDMIQFVLRALGLARQAIVARDFACGIARKRPIEGGLPSDDPPF